MRTLFWLISIPALVLPAGALEEPSIEEVTLRERVKTLAETATDTVMLGHNSIDPLVDALYAERLRWQEGASLPWVEAIDRDIRRRPEARNLLASIFRLNKWNGERSLVMHWLQNNLEVSWGDEIMEEAIKLYRADPQGWGDSHRLRMLVSVRGNESHLPFFDELDENDGAPGSGREELKYRREREKEWAEYFGLGPNVPVSELAKYVRFDLTPNGYVPVYVGIGPMPKGDPPCPFGRRYLPKAQRQKNLESASKQTAIQPLPKPSPTKHKDVNSDVQPMVSEKAATRLTIPQFVAGAAIVIAAAGLMWMLLKSRVS